MTVHIRIRACRTDAMPMSTSITIRISIRWESCEIIQTHNIGHVKLPLYSNGVGVDQVQGVHDHRSSEKIDWPGHCDEARTKNGTQIATQSKGKRSENQFPFGIDAFHRLVHAAIFAAKSLATSPNVRNGR